MGVLDTIARNVASTMVGKFGQTVRLRERAAGNYDATAATVSTFKYEHEVSAIIMDFAAAEVQGLVQTGDKKVLIAAKDLPRVPTVEWELKIGTRWHTIRHVKTDYSGDEPATHQIVARGMSNEHP
jgi:hypothetical protein